MAESFSVKAILSAADRGFTSTMKAASGCVDHMKTTLKSGIGFGVMMAAGQAAFNTGAPGGARFLRVQVPNPPGSGKDIAEGKGVHREVESEGSRMWGIY